MPYVTSWERNAEERGMKRGIEKGERIGIERGMKNGKLETAKRMLNRGVSIEDIMLYTGLTEKEVRSLLN